jgi:hypothetical protein
MKRKILTHLFLIIFLLVGNSVFSQDFAGDLSNLITIKNDMKSRRISTADPTGNNHDNTGLIKIGEKK